MNKEFRISQAEAHLLDQLMYAPLQVHLLGVSMQDVVPEPGVLCQAVRLRTAHMAVPIKLKCADFGDVEVFWPSISRVDESDRAEQHFLETSTQRPLACMDSPSGWQAVPFSIEYERKSSSTLKADMDFGVLFHLRSGNRLLVTTAPLPFFLRCVSDSHDIDAILESMPTKLPKDHRALELI